MSQIQSPAIVGKCLVISHIYRSTKSSHLAAQLLLAIVLLAAMLDCPGTVQYRYCTGACVPASVVWFFLPRVLYRFAPQVLQSDTRK